MEIRNLKLDTSSCFLVVVSHLSHFKPALARRHRKMILFRNYF